MATLFGDDLAALVMLLRAAQAKCDKASDARRALPPGSSRARVTTANARWMRACEARDRIANKIDNARSVASALERG